jgi:hypothetical protein
MSINLKKQWISSSAGMVYLLRFPPPRRSVLFIQTHHRRDAMEDTNTPLTPKICNGNTSIHGVDFLASWCCGERDKVIAIVLKYIEKTLNAWYCTLCWKKSTCLQRDEISYGLHLFIIENNWYCTTLLYQQWTLHNWGQSLHFLEGQMRHLARVGQDNRAT